MISKSMAAVLVVLLCATVSQAQSVLNETFDNLISDRIGRFFRRGTPATDGL